MTTDHVKIIARTRHRDQLIILDRMRSWVQDQLWTDEEAEAAAAILARIEHSTLLDMRRAAAADAIELEQYAYRDPLAEAFGSHAAPR